MTFAPWPSFTGEEAEAVSRVLLSNRVNYWTGDEGRAFERDFAALTGTAHAVAVANGTVALDLAWRALGIGPGDEVVVTPRTFLASASSVVNAGAIPVFADVDPDSQNITPESVEAVLTPRTRAVLAVHLAGWPCEMDRFGELAAAHSIHLVEDCAQAHGARFRDRAVGAWSDVAAWSFCQDKIITTGGEGGMATTDDAELWSRIWSFKDHGKSWEAVYKRNHPPGYRWLHDSFGTNWRLTEIQSAIGRIQIGRLPQWHAARAANAAPILSAAQDAGLRAPLPPAHVTHAWYRAYAFVEPETLREGWDRDRVQAEIAAFGVPVSSGSCPEIYLEKAFDGTGWRPATRLPVAKRLGETSLAFLVHPTLTEEDIDRTCAAISEVMKRALR